MKSRGMCIKHYDRWRIHGDPTIVLRIASQLRFQGGNPGRQPQADRPLQPDKRTNGPHDDIEVADLYDLEGGICYLCGGDVMAGWDDSRYGGSPST
jgi:hypothetical protein